MLAEREPLTTRPVEASASPPDGDAPPRKPEAMAWGVPMTKIAARFGISDVMIGKHCKRCPSVLVPCGYYVAFAEE